MPGDEDGLSPDAAPAGDSHQHTRIADKQRFAGKPDSSQIPDEEGTRRGDVDEEAHENPEAVSLNRRDVPDTPENSIEARTEGGG